MKTQAKPYRSHLQFAYPETSCSPRISFNNGQREDDTVGDDETWIVRDRLTYKRRMQLVDELTGAANVHIAHACALLEETDELVGEGKLLVDGKLMLRSKRRLASRAYIDEAVKNGDLIRDKKTG